MHDEVIYSRDANTKEQEPAESLIEGVDATVVFKSWAKDRYGDNESDDVENEIEVYISLFQSDGYNINKWSMQLRSLDRYVVGRPVYQHEADAQKRVRLREAATANEAYVVVAIKKSDIQPANAFATTLKDQFDLPLLSLKETAVRNGRINAFVHQGKRYGFVDGQLV